VVVNITTIAATGIIAYDRASGSDSNDTDKK
jgi:hypothetical protein